MKKYLFVSREKIIILNQLKLGRVSRKRNKERLIAGWQNLLEEGEVTYMMSDKEIKKNDEKENKEEMSDTGLRLNNFEDSCGSHMDLYGTYVDPCRFDIEDPCCCHYHWR